MQPGETICLWPVRAAGASLAVVGLIRSLSRVRMIRHRCVTRDLPRLVGKHQALCPCWLSAL
jgi:hypothetical protein